MIILTIALAILLAAAIATLLFGNEKTTDKEALWLANRARQEKRGFHMSRLRALLEQQGSVTNDDVQRALRVSDATATNYLKDMEKAGEIVRQGESRGTTYKKNG